MPRAVLTLLLPLAIACGYPSAKTGGEPATASQNADAGAVSSNAGSGAASALPDCKGEWPAEWVAKEQQLAAAVNAARAKGGTCNGHAHEAVPPWAVDPLLTQISRCFAVGQAMAGSRALVGSAADNALASQAAMAFTGRLCGYSGDNVAASADEVLAGWLSTPAACAAIFDPTATLAAVGYVAYPEGGVAQRWVGLCAAVGK